MFGHPRGLYILFMTEMWERMSFYGMKALLILYMINYLLWNQEEASHVMAWYAGLVYLTPAFGGILADKVFGARWAVVIGGVLICIGHFLLAFEPLPFFYSGLGFLIAGVGFLKPNISTQVGSLYARDDHRRDAAFTIFYMGINLGALIGPIICGWLRLAYGFHYGFAAAGVGMLLGIIVYLFGMNSVVRRTEEVALLDAQKEAEEEAEAAGEPTGPPAHVVRDRIVVLGVIFIFVIVFWMAFEQAANVMTVWADKHTNLEVFKGQATEADVFDPTAAPTTAPADEGFTWSLEGLRNLKVGAEFILAVNPFFIIVLAGVFAWFWVWLDRRKKQPSTPTKMTLGMFGIALAYGVILLGAAAEGQPTSTTLKELPEGLQVDEEGRLYTLSDDDGERVYFGATRLTWDAETETLHMEGVLTDLDWLRLLGATAPPDYRQEVRAFAEEAEEQAGIAADESDWVVTMDMPGPVDKLHPVAKIPEIVDYDAASRTLSATDKLSERQELELVAAAADPQFREAITEIYKESSVLKVSVMWLILFYLVCTMAELCLSPVGLSLVTKMAPPKYVGLFMGLWFVTTGAAANFLAHFIGGRWGKMTPTEYFLMFGAVALVAAVLMAVLVPMLKRKMHGIP